MWSAKKADEQIKRRVIKLLLEQSVLTTNWIFAKLKNASDGEISSALVELRNEGVVACADKRWYIRDRKMAHDRYSAA